MTQLVRIPLAWPIGTRSGLSEAKDPYIRNGILEKYGDKLFVLKRPGTQDFITLGPGTGVNQAVTYYNGFYYGVVSDTLFRSAGTDLSATTGTAFTLSTTPKWQARNGFGAAVFQNRMYVIGGSAAPNAVSDTWYSLDGQNWSVNAGANPWGARSSMQVVVFQDQMYLSCGTIPGTAYKDVWATPDGTNWTNTLTTANSPFPARYQHCMVAAHNGMYIYGGIDSAGTEYHDVWFSSDGATWTEAEAAPGWSVRNGAVGLYFNNRIWLIGGVSAGVQQNDVWYSYDGTNWVRATAAAFGSARSQMYGCVYNGAMWIIGGSTPGATAQVYKSTDGITWTLVTSAPGFTARRLGAALPFAVPSSVNQYRYPTIWVIGGDTGATLVNDVYYGAIDASTPTSFAIEGSYSGKPYQFNTFLSSTQLLVKNSTDFFVLQGGTLTHVTDSNYPAATVPGIVVLNGFAYVMTPQGEIHSCQIEHPTVWPSLQFVTAEYEDDAGVALAKHLNYVVALGTYTTQFFYDNGANQPVGSALAPYINANLRVGCAAAGSVANVDNSLYWVSQTQGGGRTVVRMDGLQLTTVSTPYVDKLIMNVAAASLIGINFAVGGHQYYVLKTSPTEALVYDTTFQEWYEWDTFPYIDFATDFTTTALRLMSLSAGKLMTVSASVYDDAMFGNFTLSCETDKIDHGNTALKFCGRAVLVGDRSTAQPSITYTDDDYQTYITAGAVNMNLGRPYLTRLGSFRRRAWRPTQTDNYPARWEALEVEYSQGES